MWARWINEVYPDVYVKNCEIGNGFMDSMLMPVSSQIEQLSACINDDPLLASGFVAVPMSQGGVVMRGYIEKYNHLRFKALRLVAVSCPLGGIFCGRDVSCAIFGEFPELLNDLIYDFAYEDVLQKHLSLANYWRDPF